MNFRLIYKGEPGDVTATLSADGEAVASTSGLADRKDAEKWAARTARDHKVDNTPAATAAHQVVLNGTKTFSL
jgi:hypothetical protein